MASIKGSTHVPMMAIPHQLEIFNKDEPIYLLCHSGVRSAQACLYLEQQGFDSVNIIGVFMLGLPKLIHQSQHIKLAKNNITV